MSRTAARNHIRFMLFSQGAGRLDGAWRHPDADPAAIISFAHHKALAAVAERGFIDAYFIADALALNAESQHGHLSKLEPVVLISALAAVTNHLGLIATVSTSYAEPYNVARAILTADHISAGRAGWNVVTTRDSTNSTAFNFSKDEHFEHGSRYDRANEFVDVVRGLWRSWDQDAFVYDKQAGIYFDPAKLHKLDHRGEFFSRIDGPLNLAASPQGEPLILQAGLSEAGMKLAARVADAVYTVQDDLPKAQAYRRLLREAATTHGRDPDSIYVFGGVTPVIGRSQEHAEQLLAELHDLAPRSNKVIKHLTTYFGGKIDFSGLAPDMTIRQSGILDTPDIRTDFQDYVRGHEDRLTLQDLYVYLAEVRINPDFIGTPEKIADNMIRWFDEGGLDGFVLVNALLPRDIELFVDEVLPILRARGYASGEYRDETLRQRLDLPVRPYPAG